MVCISRRPIAAMMLLTGLMGCHPAVKQESTSAPEKPVLTYNQDGEFRILQLTDLHTVPYPEFKSRNDSTLSLIAQLVRKEQPQVIAITGDIVVSGNARQGWQELCALLDSLQTPYFINFGNHDTEADMRKEEVIELLQGERYCINDDKFHETLSGEGNGRYIVYDASGEQARNVLYNFDSHAYPAQKGLGTYDWIKWDQISWYHDFSSEICQDLGILPSLAFFHIPLPEYASEPADSDHFIGNKLEAVCAPELNSGLLTYFLEQGDVIGVFVGHDHNNDYLLNYRDRIALAYGRKTGYPAAYVELLERGGRMIILKEGEKAFDTYITTLSGTSDNYTFRVQ